MNTIAGKDLIGLGFEPAPWFGEVLREANGRNLSISQAARLARDRIEAIAAAEEERRAREIPLRDSPAPYRFNITVEDEGEEANVAAVRETFDELMRTPTLEAGAVMPDACPAGPMGTIPVGGVVAARDAIHPGMHSADICCSMTATVVDGVSPAELLDAIHAVTHFGPGGRKRHEEFDLPKDLREAFDANPFLTDQKIRSRARSDFGTCGDGNHFNFVGISEATGKTILVSHFGSRGPGALLYKAGMSVAERVCQEISPETLPGNAWIPFGSDEGRDYWSALQFIREWTRLSHAALHDAAIAHLGPKATAADRLWNEHNFVFREEDEKGSLFWHAKGATPIHTPFLPDTDGTQIVPLNMSQPILFVRGERSDTNLGFAPHGAGRNLSRTQHKRSMEGESDAAIFARETAGIDARFFCGKIDVSELPSAYKDADRVQADMKRFGLCDVTDRILPHGAIMAGDWEANAPWRRKK
ncbi:RtcB family protein [Defluviimonas salinarum]|uniref:3'-phosphate/5'-hydroxy nucleic acid ligase n=1 Tax=Defluviimonas salinarum TaxID=2992147 RepID=A0ABT3J9E8_9RHOB|nr:RtcB family protein [Defluviimonas salinarum]MCW3784317.1 RtcB family protein [Defluviimonas salinarum]